MGMGRQFLWRGAWNEEVQPRQVPRQLCLKAHSVYSASPDLFSGLDADVQETTIDEIVEEQKALAAHDLLKLLRELGPIYFSKVWVILLQAYMLRVTNVKDICVDLAKIGKIDNTWGGGTRKPRDEDMIKLKLG
jgi:hypothetical protein